MPDIRSTSHIDRIDGISRRAEAVAATLRTARKDIVALQAALAASGITDRLQGRLKALGAGAAHIDGVAKAWRDYARAEGLAAKASDGIGAQAASIMSWERVTVSATRAVRKEEAALARDRARHAKAYVDDAVAGIAAIRDVYASMRIGEHHRMFGRERRCAQNVWPRLFSGCEIAGRRAAGGAVGAGQAYLVGEIGPEVFVPGASGQITSNARLIAASHGFASRDKVAGAISRVREAADPSDGLNISNKTVPRRAVAQGVREGISSTAFQGDFGRMLALYDIARAPGDGGDAEDARRQFSRGRRGFAMRKRGTPVATFLASHREEVERYAGGQLGRSGRHLDNADLFVASLLSQQPPDAQRRTGNVSFADIPKPSAAETPVYHYTLAPFTEYADGHTAFDPRNAGLVPALGRLVYGATVGLLPFGHDMDGNIQLTNFDSNAGILGATKRTVMASGQVLLGQLDPDSDEGRRRIFEAALMLAGGISGKSSFSAAESVGARNLSIYDPPMVKPRPFAADYPKGAVADDVGKLAFDIDGHPLTAPTIVGRRVVGGDDQALTPQELNAVAKAGTGRFPETVPPGSPGLGRTNAGAVTATRGGIPLLVSISNRLAPAQAQMVLGHEVGHVVDLLAGGIPQKGLSSELNRLYNTLNNGNRSLDGTAAATWSKATRPVDLGYSKADGPAELRAEAIRAYMANPNYMKSEARETAAAIRKAVNRDPRLSKIIQFNTAPLSPLLLPEEYVRDKDGRTTGMRVAEQHPGSSGVHSKVITFHNGLFGDADGSNWRAVRRPDGSYVGGPRNPMTIKGVRPPKVFVPLGLRPSIDPNQPGKRGDLGTGRARHAALAPAVDHTHLDATILRLEHIHRLIGSINSVSAPHRKVGGMHHVPGLGARTRGGYSSGGLSIG